MDAYAGSGSSSTKHQVKNIRMEDITAMMNKGSQSTKNSSSASLADRIRKMYRNPPVGGGTVAFNQTGNPTVASSTPTAAAAAANSSFNNGTTAQKSGNLKDLLDNFYKRNSSSNNNKNQVSSPVLQTNSHLSNTQNHHHQQHLSGQQNNMMKQSSNGAAHASNAVKPSEGLKNYVTNIIMKKMTKEEMKENQENIQFYAKQSQPSQPNINNNNNMGMQQQQQHLQELQQQHLLHNQQPQSFCMTQSSTDQTAQYQKKKSHSISNNKNSVAMPNNIAQQNAPQRYAVSNQRPSQRPNELESSNALNNTTGTNNNYNGQYSPCTKAALQYHQQQVYQRDSSYKNMTYQVPQQIQQQQQQQQPQTQVLQLNTLGLSQTQSYNQKSSIGRIEQSKSPIGSSSVSKKRTKQGSSENLLLLDSLNYSQQFAPQSIIIQTPSGTQQGLNYINQQSGQIVSSSNFMQLQQQQQQQQIQAQNGASNDCLKNSMRIHRDKSNEGLRDNCMLALQESNNITNNNNIIPQPKRTMSNGKQVPPPLLMNTCYNPNSIQIPATTTNASNSMKQQHAHMHTNSGSNLLVGSATQSNYQQQGFNLNHSNNNNNNNNNIGQTTTTTTSNSNNPNTTNFNFMPSSQNLNSSGNSLSFYQKQQQASLSLGKPSTDSRMKVASVRENKKIEFPTYLNNASSNGLMTCDNKRKQNEHFQFDFPATTTNAQRQNTSSSGVAFPSQTSNSILTSNNNNNNTAAYNGQQFLQTPSANINNQNISASKNYDPITTVVNTQVYDCEENTTTAKKQKPHALMDTAPLQEFNLEQNSTPSMEIAGPYNPFLSTNPPKDFADNISFLMNDSQSYEPDKYLSAIPDEMDRKTRVIESPKKYDKTAKFKEEYLVGKQVGQGAYACVRVALNKIFNKKIAIKIYEKERIKEPQRKKSVRREIKLLQILNHPNVIKIYDTIETNNHVNIIMEYIPGTSLHGYLKSQTKRRLTESDAKRIFRQLVSSIEYCHSKEVCHRDIKLENILLDETNSPKLIDFGFSTCIPNSKKYKMFCGTPSYMAPEIVNKLEYSGPPADMWALGVLLYALLCGTFPFKGQTDKELYKKISSGEFFQPDFLTKESIDFIHWILNVNADERPTATETLSHPWLQLEKKGSTSQTTPPFQSTNSNQSTSTPHGQGSQPIQQNSDISTKQQHEILAQSASLQQQQQQQQQNYKQLQLSSSELSNTVLVNTFLQQNSPFNNGNANKQFKFNNPPPAPQRAPSANSAAPTNQQVHSQNQDVIGMQASSTLRNSSERQQSSQGTANSNVFFYPPNTRNAGQGFINIYDGSPTAKPPLPLPMYPQTTKSSSVNYQNYFVNNNNNNTSNKNLAESPMSYNSSNQLYNCVQKRRTDKRTGDGIRGSHQEFSNPAGDCTYISDKNNLSNLNGNQNYPSSIMQQGSSHGIQSTAGGPTHSSTNFALHHLNEDEPINSVDSEILQSIVYMGYNNDEESLVNGIKDPKNPLFNLYKKLYNKKIHTNKTIYPSHIPSNSQIASIGSSKSPTSQSTASGPRGFKRGLNIPLPTAMDQHNAFSSSYTNINSSKNNGSIGSGSFLGTQPNRGTSGRHYDQEIITPSSRMHQHLFQ